MLCHAARLLTACRGADTMGMAAPTYWTAEMVRQLPDDGNRYEVVYGELLVTPACRCTGWWMVQTSRSRCGRQMRSSPRSSGSGSCGGQQEPGRGSRWSWQSCFVRCDVARQENAKRSEARVYRRDRSLSLLQEHDSLDGEDVLPGFSCSLQAVLAR